MRSNNAVAARSLRAISGSTVGSSVGGPPAVAGVCGLPAVDGFVVVTVGLTTDDAEPGAAGDGAAVSAGGAAVMVLPGVARAARRRSDRLMPSPASYGVGAARRR